MYLSDAFLSTPARIVTANRGRLSYLEKSYCFYVPRLQRT